MSNLALEELVAALSDSPLSPWKESLLPAIISALSPVAHGDLCRWQKAVASLPHLPPDATGLNSGTLRIGPEKGVSVIKQEALRAALRALRPWRKGPFLLHGIPLETEWRSDWKWDRITPHLTPLAGRKVLDIGCGNGYHCLRMVAEGATQVWGVDPNILFHHQFAALKQLTGPVPAWHIPLTIEALPSSPRAFDTVFSLGVLYHRKDPIGHLEQLRGLARPGGEVIVETLVVEGNATTCLIPEERYAMMRNVWFLPSTLLLERMLKRSGFSNVRIVNVTATSVEEQHSTEWMPYHSLPNFLSGADPSLTVEGYPAPARAVAIARAP